MRFHVAGTDQRSLHPDVAALLVTARRDRGFQVAEVADAKAEILNAYFGSGHLDAAVVALSGGIDSAVVLALTAHAARQERSPIEQIVAVTLPVFAGAATNQPASVARARDCADACEVPLVTVDLTDAHEALTSAVGTALGVRGEAWALGQAVAVTRTPALYYVTSLLAQQGRHPVICGTTNRDEGAYLGYVGKSSDGMVDLQLISDLHKSEVRALAAHLGVPTSVLAAVPSGDMFDGRVDEEVFGAPYDFVELYLWWLTLHPLAQDAYWRRLSAPAARQFEVLASNLEALHAYNAHKYLASSPAVHLDLLEAFVPNGWRYATWTAPAPQVPAPVDSSNFVGLFDDAGLFDAFDSAHHAVTVTRPLAATPTLGAVQQLRGLLSADEVAAVRSLLDELPWEPVGADGIRGHYHPGDPIGSYRATAHSDRVAALLWARLAPHLGEVSAGWQAVAVSSLLRFIRYDVTGTLIPHYDAPYEFDDGRRTALSLIMYFDDTGATRFLVDPQLGLPDRERDFRDWDRSPAPDEVLAVLRPGAGGALLFPHRLLHDSEPSTSSKVVCRADIVVARR